MLDVGRGTFYYDGGVIEVRIAIVLLLMFGSNWFARGYDDITNHADRFGWWGIVVGSVMNLIGVLLLFKLNN